MQMTDPQALSTLREAVRAHRTQDLALHVGNMPAAVEAAAARDTAMLALARAGRRVTLYTIDGFDRPDQVQWIPPVR